MKGIADDHEYSRAFPNDIAALANPDVIAQGNGSGESYKISTQRYSAALARSDALVDQRGTSLQGRISLLPILDLYATLIKVPERFLLYLSQRLRQCCCAAGWGSRPPAASLANR